MKETLVVDMMEYGDEFFRIKVRVPGEERFEAPVPLNLPSPTKPTNPAYNVTFEDDEGNFAIVVQRVVTKKVIFDTRIGGFTYADQLLQVSTRLPGGYLYGLGEAHHASLVHDLQYVTWPMFARDQAPGEPGQNLYGVHPMYQVMEEGGYSHAVLWLNSNAMEAETDPSPGLTMRAIGGIMDLYFFLGDTPSSAIKGYLGAVGFPMLPPYWALGFQLCRYGYNTLDNLKAAVSRTRRNGLPQDVQYADIDHMDRRMDFTHDKVNWAGLPDYIREVKKTGLRFIIILDPAINAELSETEYQVHARALEKDVYIKWPEGQEPSENYGAGDIMLGYVWPDNRTAFPDFFRNSTHEWWSDEIHLLYNDIEFDGLWIDMNEPANFGTNEERPWNWPEEFTEDWSLKCPPSNWDDPPFPTAAATVWGKRLSDKTLCMVARQGEERELLHYDVHNLYGWSQTPPTLRALQNVTGRRGLVVSRSTFPSSGRWAGHWLGDNTARWEDLRKSVIGMLEFNLFGLPYVGADICGFFGDTTEELCQRWMQLGAFYPYSRNHNQADAIDHDPGLWPSVARSGREALEIRYLLLPYLYTLHYLAHSQGHTVIRPLFFEFPSTVSTWAIDDQFLWGSWLMVAPVVWQGAESREVYFPEAPWYDYYPGRSIQKVGEKVKVAAPLSYLPLYVRGGGVVATQRIRSNTMLARTEPLGLIIAPDWEGKATGMLYWDEGESIDPVGSKEFFIADIAYDNEEVTWSVREGEGWKGVAGLVMSDVRVFNVTSRPSHITLDSKRWTHGDWHYDASTQTLELFDLFIPINSDFILSWAHQLEYNIPCPISYADLPRHDEASVTKEICEARNCTWEDTAKTCSIPPPSDYGLVFADGLITETERGFRTHLRAHGKALYPGQIEDVVFEVFKYGDRLLRVKFFDGFSPRFEPPVSLNLPDQGSTNPAYTVHVPTDAKAGDIFYFYVQRVDSGTIIFDTRLGGLTITDQFLSITSTLASRNVYGLGENTHDSFRHQLHDNPVWPIFSRDQGPVPGAGQRVNLYGSQPYYQVMENDGNSHGILLLNSNAIDYQLLDYPAITFRTIGGVLDLYMVLGPEPESVVAQYTSLIHRPVMPPYWALGFQLCRYGYGSLQALQAAVNRTREAEIPHDVQYGDIDYMDRRMDFTVDPKNYGGLQDYIREVKEGGLRFVVILDPAINAELPADEYEPHQRAVEMGAYITWPDDTNATTIEHNHAGGNHSNIMLGYVWPENRTAFPSFLRVAGQEWWMDEIERFYQDVQFDGLWIDMNEPANFGTNEAKPFNWPEGVDDWALSCPASQWDDPPYVTKAAAAGPSHRMSDKTLCLSAQDGNFTHYDVHNLYGWAQTEPTYRVVQSVTGQRGLVVTRSTFPGSGQWSGHWLGDNRSNWTDMAHSITGMLEFNLFGLPYVGADICGFFGNTTEELCQRWMQLGAFYPYSRNHNAIGNVDQDPGMWPETVGKASKAALEIRYRLLPYLYTLFYQAHVEGFTVVRPLHHEFPRDRRTLGIDDQFLWGSGFMVSPVLKEGQVERQVYFPQDNWFDYYTGQPVETPGDYSTIPAPLHTIPLHVHGSTIIPTQRPANNTKFSRLEPMGVIVGIGRDRRASGLLFWDDGESIDTVEAGEYGLVGFEFVQTILTSHITKGHSLLDSLHLQDIEVLGVERAPKAVIHNGAALSSSSYDYDSKGMRLRVRLEKQTLGDLLTLEIQGIWQYEVDMS